LDPKALRPAGKHKLVEGMLADWGVSIRRACTACDHLNWMDGFAPKDRRYLALPHNGRICSALRGGLSSIPTLTVSRRKAQALVITYFNLSHRTCLRDD
jgi:hypothetical protein